MSEGGRKGPCDVNDRFMSRTGRHSTHGQPVDSHTVKLGGQGRGGGSYPSDEKVNEIVEEVLKGKKVAKKNKP
jgi:hypothetical protein